MPSTGSRVPGAEYRVPSYPVGSLISPGVDNVAGSVPRRRERGNSCGEGPGAHGSTAVERRFHRLGRYSGQTPPRQARIPIRLVVAPGSGPSAARRTTDPCVAVLRRARAPALAPLPLVGAPRRGSAPGAAQKRRTTRGEGTRAVRRNEGTPRHRRSRRGRAVVPIGAVARRPIDARLWTAPSRRCQRHPARALHSHGAARPPWRPPRQGRGGAPPGDQGR